MNKMILQNEAECLRCGDRIYSGSRHDFKSCSCGDVAVDGGQEYIRRVFGTNAQWREHNLTAKDGDALKQLVHIVKFLMHNQVEDDVIMLLVCLVYHRDHDQFQPKYQTQEFQDDVLTEIDKMKDSGRNAVGIVLGVIRVIREHRMLDPELFEEPAETVNPE